MWHSFRAGSPQVMGCNVLQARSLAAGLDYVPHHILRDAFPPHLSGSGDGSEDPSIRDSGRSYPLIERSFDPLGNGHGADARPCRSGLPPPSAPDASGSHPTPCRQVPIFGSHNQTAMPAWRSRASLAYCHHKHVGVLPNSAPALNQLPTRNPSCLTPLTRLIPAASSGLSKSASAAS